MIIIFLNSRRLDNLNDYLKTYLNLKLNCPSNLIESHLRSLLSNMIYGSQVNNRMDKQLIDGLIGQITTKKVV